MHFYNPFCSSQSSRFCFFFSVPLEFIAEVELATVPSWLPGSWMSLGIALTLFKSVSRFVGGWKSGIWWTKNWLVLRKEIVFLEDWDDADEVHPSCIMVDEVECCCCCCKGAPPMRETSLIPNYRWHIIGRRVFRILNMFIRHGFTTLDWDGMHLATRPGRCGGAQWRWLLWVRWQVPEPHEIHDIPPARRQNHHWAAGKRDFWMWWFAGEFGKKDLKLTRELVI